MEMQYVESSNIKSIGYDSENAVLTIEFNNNYVYEYYEVPQYEYEGLMGADSKGKYGYKNIYYNYKGNRIR